jgi:hypothetical protein
MWKCLVESTGPMPARKAAHARRSGRSWLAAPVVQCPDRWCSHGLQAPPASAAHTSALEKKKQASIVFPKNVDLGFNQCWIYYSFLLNKQTLEKRVQESDHIANSKKQKTYSYDNRIARSFAPSIIQAHAYVGSIILKCWNRVREMLNLQFF